jgi:hypothetical protein
MVPLSDKIDTIFIGNSITNTKFKQAHPWLLLDSGANTKNLTFLATIKITGGPKLEKCDFVIMDGQINGKIRIESSLDNWPFMYAKIDRLADKWGANAFMLKEFYYDRKTSNFSFILDAFKATDSAYSAIKAKKEKNIIYIFPNWDYDARSVRFRIGEKLIKIDYPEYLKYSIGINEVVKVNREGDYHTYIKWEPDQSPIYVVRYDEGVDLFNISLPPHVTITYGEGFGELMRKTIYRDYLVIQGANNEFTLPSKADIKKVRLMVPVVY